MDKIEKAQKLYSARNLAGLSQDEASRLVGVTKRAWQYWESTQREVPLQILELFLLKLNTSWSDEKRRDLVVVMHPQSHSTPMATLSNQNYLGYTYDKTTNEIVVKSYTYDIFTKMRQVSKTRFPNTFPNDHVLKWLVKWEKELNDELEE